jgi:hypothetical protein
VPTSVGIVVHFTKECWLKPALREAEQPLNHQSVSRYWKRNVADSPLWTSVAPMIMQARTVPRRKTLRRNLRAMNADGFSFSVMVGIAESYLPAFVLARGLGDLTAAMVATVPVLLGSILQLFAPFLLQKLGSYRRFVVTTARFRPAAC